MTVTRRLFLNRAVAGLMAMSFPDRRFRPAAMSPRNALMSVRVKHRLR